MAVRRPGLKVAVTFRRMGLSIWTLLLPLMTSMDRASLSHWISNPFSTLSFLSIPNNAGGGRDRRDPWSGGHQYPGPPAISSPGVPDCISGTVRDRHPCSSNPLCRTNIWELFWSEYCFKMIHLGMAEETQTHSCHERACPCSGGEPKLEERAAANVF